jgi:hypothetical protein
MNGKLECRRREGLGVRSLVAYSTTIGRSENARERRQSTRPALRPLTQISVYTNAI